MKRILSTLIGLLLMTWVVSTQSIRAQEDTGRLLKQLEESSDRFSKSLNKALDQSAYNGTNTEDEINGYVKQYEDSTDRLKKNYDKQQDNRIATEEVLQRARTINTFLKSHKLNPTVQTDWNTVKSDLARLGKANKVKVKW